MSSDPRPGLPLADPVPPLTLTGLPAWAARLAGPDPLPDPALAAEADTAGVQFLVSTLLWAPGRLSFDPSGDSPAAALWRRLGLGDPADAEPVLEGDRITAFRPRKEMLQ